MGEKRGEIILEFYSNIYRTYFSKRYQMNMVLTSKGICIELLYFFLTTKAFLTLILVMIYMLNGDISCFTYAFMYCEFRCI